MLWVRKASPWFFETRYILITFVAIPTLCYKILADVSSIIEITYILIILIPALQNLLIGTVLQKQSSQARSRL